MGPGASRFRLRTLPETTLTPWEAFQADLLFVREALDAGGIDYFIVRSKARPAVIVVDLAEQATLESVLADACRDEPFYSRTEKMSRIARDDLKARARGGARLQEVTPPDDLDRVAADSVLFSVENEPEANESAPVVDGVMPGKRTVLVSNGRLSNDPNARAFTLFRPREAARGALTYGSEFGVPLELWEYTTTVAVGDGLGQAHVAGDVIAPRPNMLLRHRTPRAELVRDEVELFGQRWSTVRGMFDRTVDDVDMPIDLVFSWVDGSSEEFRKRRAERMREFTVGEGDDHEARIRQVEELRYALRSVHMFAPWIRTIHIATDSERPAWLADHPRVRIHRSEDFFPDLSVLPTYSSHAVESQLHHIDGLSEHFLYSNDDMFFGRPVSPSMFFSAGGVSRFILSNIRIGVGEPDPSRSGFENAARVNREVLRRRFGTTITRHLEHAATPLRRSVMAELEREFPEEFATTAAGPFRKATDVSVTNSLYHYYALLTGRAVPQTDAKVVYIDTTSREGIRQMKKLLTRRGVDFFCLNDGSFPEVEEEVRVRAMRDFLEQYFPIKAPWERVVP